MEVMTRRSSANAGIGLMVVTLAIIIFCAGCWIGNAVKLARCDWSPDGSWKGEVIHAIGLMGPVAVVTVWFDDK
jgi:hypothetical protein